jgi:hypothetical protein
VAWIKLNRWLNKAKKVGAVNFVALLSHFYPLMRRKTDMVRVILDDAKLKPVAGKLLLRNVPLHAIVFCAQFRVRVRHP